MKDPISFILQNREKLSKVDKLVTSCVYTSCAYSSSTIPNDERLKMLSNVQELVDLFSALIDDAPLMPTSWKI